MKKLNGIRLKHRKNTEDFKTVQLPLPKKVIFPMSMHMGAPCTPLVKVGDVVKVGDKIGDCENAFSVPIHSSVSGTVAAVSDYINAMGNKCKCVEIETDGLQTLSESINPPVITDKLSFINAVRESGVCGLGGAGFPTHIKLNPKNEIDTLIINAAECEPYITSDYREMIENTDDVLNGIEFLRNMLGIKQIKIAVEANKPQAIKNFQELTKNDSTVSIVELPSIYPQGAEKVIIYNSTKRIVEEGTIPADIGVIVINVSTVAFIYRYIQTGMPFITRRVTVDGNAVKNPKNVFIPVGTPIVEVLNFCNAEIDNLKVVLTGGPMMGMCVHDINMPILKTTNALLAFNRYDDKKTSACIRCGRCAAVCPFNLIPAEIEKAYKTRDIEDLKSLKVNLCMNCGSCTYVCPANRKLAETNQLAKTILPRN
ncbi:MAG: electron transport complex subunit RsxC [Ruminococcus sp.]|nr:electron transport complex subunit RsxC [Ruminococcus sp.]